MTWRLIVGQMRAHRGYFAWTATLLTMLTAILTFTVVAGATQSTLWSQVDALRHDGLLRHGSLLVGTGPDDHPFAITTPEQVQELIDTTPGSTASTSTVLRRDPLFDSDPFVDTGFEAVAKYGGESLEWMLAEGRLPAARGEVALAFNVAQDLNVSVGDDVTLYAEQYQGDNTWAGVPVSLTLVGITATQHLAGYDVYPPGAILAWDEVGEGGLFRSDGPSGFWSEGLDAAFVSLHWDGPAPLLDPYFEYEGSYWYGNVAFPQSATLWFVVTFVLVIAMIIMSFSVGRSQAAARTQWIATVRTMGATRKYVAAATVLETLLIALFASLAGLVLGTLAAQMHLSIARAMAGAPFGAATVSLHWVILPIVGVVAVVVALLIAAVPAFWASRVDPVAALKPVNDITETELSRRVSPHWLWIPLVGGILLILLGNWQTTAPLDAVIVLGMISAGLALIALSVEASRWSIPYVGRRLARSRKPSRITAGDALASRPKQAVAPALLTAAAIGTLAILVMGNATNPYGTVLFRGYADFAYDRSATIAWWWQQLVNPSALVAVVLVTMTIQLVAASMFVAHRTATSREGATRRALGLTARQLTRAHWWQQWAPQATGAVVGLAVGLGVAEIWRLLNVLTGSGMVASVPTTVRALALAAIVGAIGIMLLAGALTAWVVARTGTRATPLGQALRAH